jgi:hypothetical protein
MFTKKSISYGMAILFIGALTLTNFMPVHATPPASVESKKAADAQFISSKQLSGMDISMPQADGGTTTRDIVLVIDTSSAMAFETDSNGDPLKGEPTENPEDCNAAMNDPNNRCEPLGKVIDAAVAFVDELSFPYDRVALVSSTGQDLGSAAPDLRQPVTLLDFSDDEEEVKAAIRNLRVFQPARCPMPPSADYLYPCLFFNPTYITQMCYARNFGLDPTTCGVSNIGGGLYEAGYQFANARQSSARVVVALFGGPANASNTTGYPDGRCPETTWSYPGNSGYCRDLDTMPASFNPPSVSSWNNAAERAAFFAYSNNYWENFDWSTYTFPTRTTSHSFTVDTSTTPPTYTYGDDYDADDFARDAADYATSPSQGQGATIYSICLGAYCRMYPNTNDPASAEFLARYMSSHAGGLNASHGNYYFVPDAGILPATFQAIAEDTLCSPTVVVGNNLDAGVGSLRQAISDVCSGGTITFTSSLSGQSIHLASSLLIEKGVTIDGTSLATHVQISGDTNNDGTGDVSVFQIGGTSPVELNGLDIVKGKASSFDNVQSI